jgi:alpha-glucuronidase
MTGLRAETMNRSICRRVPGNESSLQRGAPTFVLCLGAILVLVIAATARADDGYGLWLRYGPLPADIAGPYRTRATSVVVQGRSPTLDAIRAELTDGLTGLLGQPVAGADNLSRDGAIVIGTPKSSPLIEKLGWQADLVKLGPEGFVIRFTTIGGHPATVIASESETGAL